MKLRSVFVEPTGYRVKEIDMPSPTGDATFTGRTWEAIDIDSARRIARAVGERPVCFPAGPRSMGGLVETWCEP